MGFHFPQAIWQQLTALQRDLLEELAFLQKSHPCVFPGRAYLAKKVGCSIDHVSRITTKLQTLGILEKVQRRYRRQDGTWDTRSCVYRIRPAWLWIVNQARQKTQELLAGLRARTGIPRNEKKIASPIPFFFSPQEESALFTNCPRFTWGLLTKYKALKMARLGK